MKVLIPRKEPGRAHTQTHTHTVKFETSGLTTKETRGNKVNYTW